VWLEVGSGKAALSPPAHPQVTHTVRCGQRNRINDPKPWQMSVAKSARPELGESSVFFLARPRELRGKMSKGLVLIGSPHLTKRAADGGYAPRFLGCFLTLDFNTHRG
jgi:hypothetical protein